MNKPLLLFDGDCAFCRSWVYRLKRRTQDRIDFAPYQNEAQRFPKIPLARFQESIHLFLPSGEISFGAEAVFRALALADITWMLWIYRHIPLAKALSEWGYRWVAHHRRIFPAK